ncbi:hypothetical protein [Rhizohabitans arisaemae]|uniref:hypothetical protein n=1 Tax=Rhizohabitans arisaemae TaxID=2720610 RepID=UPI0024B0D9BF|nr:hypothetical protein [Rhizohabitans arisaemae]
MRSKRAFLAAVVGTACVAAVVTADPVHAAARPHQAGKGCLAPGQIGSYLSKEGEATLTFSREFLSGVAKQGGHLKGIAPVQVINNGTAATMPIGERYDNIEIPSGRVCYPGGIAWTNPATGTTYEIDDFWIVFAAVGNSTVLATPKINGMPRAGGELVLATFSVPQALTTGQFVPHNGGIGPRRVEFTVTNAWARDLNTALGTDFTGGTPWATLDIVWRGAPSRAIPSGFSVGLLGVNLLAKAISDVAAAAGGLGRR